MFKGDQGARNAAAQMFAAVKTGLLAGIYIVDQAVPALRARKLNTWWWLLIPKAEEAILLLDPTNPTAGSPLIAFRDQIKSDPSRLDLALLKAWASYKMLRAGRLDQCESIESRPVLMAESSNPTLVSNVVPARCATETPPKEVRLLIIAPQAFSSVLKPLVDHKNLTNMPAEMINLDNVRNLFPGKDDPERVKNAIKQFHETNGVRYVLLGGDASLIPVRHRFVRQPTDLPNRWLDGTYNPAELYYANLYRRHRPSTDIASIKHSGTFDDWDLNKNGKYNEQLWKEGVALSDNPDGVDGCPDVAIGRVPAHTPEEMASYVNKVILYESHPIMANMASFAFLADKDYPNATLLSDNIAQEIRSSANNISRVGLDFEKSDPIPAGWTKGDAQSIAAAAEKNWWLSFIGHGFNRGWDAAGFDANKASALLSNSSQLPIVFSIGCDTGQFALWAPVGRYRDRNDKLLDFEVPPPDGAQFVKDKASGTLTKLPLTVPVPHPYDLPDNIHLPSGLPASLHRTFACAWLFHPRGAGSIAFFGETLVLPNIHGAELQRRALQRYAKGDRVLGDLWLGAQRQYWIDFSGSQDVLGAPRIFLGIMTMFGDPSLRVR